MDGQFAGHPRDPVVSVGAAQQTDELIGRSLPTLVHDVGRYVTLRRDHRGRAGVDVAGRGQPGGQVREHVGQAVLQAADRHLVGLREMQDDVRCGPPFAG